MAWGIEAFAFFDPFYWGAEGVILSFILWTIFAYLGSRGSSEKPLEEAMQVVGYTFGVGLLLDFMAIPSLWVAVGMTIGYVLATRYVVKWDWSKTIFILVTIFINFSILVLLPDSLRSIFLWGVLIMMLLFLSQERIRRKKIKEETKSEKK